MKCNIRCDFCSVRAGEYAHHDLPLDQIIRFIDEAADLGLEELHFLGGEPTIRDDLEAMVHHASNKGVSTRIITNGMLLPRGRIARLQDMGLGQIMVSVDGLRERHTHLRRSGVDGWAKTMRCVEDAIALGLWTRVSSTAYATNYDDMLPLLRLVNDIGAQCYSVFPGVAAGKGARHDRRCHFPVSVARAPGSRAR